MTYLNLLMLWRIFPRQLLRHFCSQIWWIYHLILYILSDIETFSLLQFDANLMEGEPYNRLNRKNKRRLNVARQNSNIFRKCGKPVPKTRQDKQRQCVARRCHQHTDFLQEFNIGRESG